jgi:undecaprenyl-diphosphatase
MHEIIIVVAKYFVVLPVVIVFLIGARLPRRQQLELLGLLTIGGVLSLLLARLSSHLYYDPRPFAAGHFRPLIPHSTDNGFPSDHTLISAFFAYVALHYNKKLGWMVMALAILIGSSRVAAGVHHIDDVLGSFIIAGAGYWLAILGIQFVNRKLIKPAKATAHHTA